MSSRTFFFKSTAIALAASFVSVTGMPVTNAEAHDRHNVYKHYGHGTSLTKNGHRKFHKKYGRGNHGTYAYQNYYHGHHYKKHKRKKRSNGDLVAAGIIGLAVGAIIASESSKRKNHQPAYQYNDPYRGSYSGGYNGGGQHIPLDEYDSSSYSSQGEPNVITYNDDVSLEPWTPGWQRWCQNRFRSFNAQTGTYRGYDGRDHFCVPN
ncbi:MAG: BA14K family protein [Pseudomonadota bacterium]